MLAHFAAQCGDTEAAIAELDDVLEMTREAHGDDSPFDAHGARGPRAHPRRGRRVR
jgi:hypothetical protein